MVPTLYPLVQRFMISPRGTPGRPFSFKENRLSLRFGRKLFYAGSKRSGTGPAGFRMKPRKLFSFWPAWYNHPEKEDGISLLHSFTGYQLTDKRILRNSRPEELNRAFLLQGAEKMDRFMIYQLIYALAAAGGCPQKRLTGKKACLPFREQPERYVLALYDRIGKEKEKKEKDETGK